MRFYILGKNKDDKGSQLETLTKNILSQYHLTNITLNEVGSGANEIDVTAEIISKTGFDEIKIPVICECKAYDTPVSMSHWLKFLGKLYTEKRINNNTIGYFIALSDVNGNVWAHFKHLKNELRDTSINLIGKDKLIELLIEDYKLQDQYEVIRYVQQFTRKKIIDSSLLYYDSAIYWIIEFMDHNYSIISSNMDFFDSEKYKEFSELLSQLPLNEFVDIKNEYDSLVRNLTLEGLSFCTVILGENTLIEIRESIGKICKDKYQFTLDEVVNSLNNNPFIICSEQILLNNQYIQENLIDFYRQLLSKPLLPSIISSDIYQENISRILMDKICELQGGLILSEEEIENCLKILKLSPKSLLLSLSEDTFIKNALKLPYKMPKANKVAKEKFIGMLMDALHEDFSQQAYWDEFHKKFNITNYSFTRELIINSGTKNELKIQDAPIVKFVQCEFPNMPDKKQIVPIIEFDKSQLK